MRLVRVTRVLVGIPLVFFSSMWFLDQWGIITFAPPSGSPGAAVSFQSALAATGYAAHVLRLVELLAGVALFANRYVPLALVALAPIAVNILLFHLFLDPAPVRAGAGYLVFVGWVFLLFAYRHVFMPLTRPHHTPSI